MNSIQNVQERRMKWAILAVFQNLQRKLVPSKYYLYAGSNLIGSNTQKCEIAIDVEGISDIHADIQITNDGDACIIDLNSKQGVFKTASLNPQKKVKIDSQHKSGIQPDNPFYLGKYKCFIVAFDEDYRKGEERRQQELKQQKQSPAQSMISGNNTIWILQLNNNYLGLKELTETDLDEEEDEKSDFKRKNSTKKRAEEIIEKTLEVSSGDEQEEEQNRQLFKGDDCEKTLEINSDREDDKDLFQVQQKDTNKNKGEDFEPTLAVESGNTSELDEIEVNDLFGAEKERKEGEEEVFEKTLELSSDGDEEQDDLFGGAPHQKKRDEDESFEKTLELSDNNSDDEKGMFAENVQAKNTSGGYEKTLELSDHSDDEDIFGGGDNNQKKPSSEVIEKTLELSDKDEEDEAGMFGDTKRSNNQNKGGFQIERTLEIGSDGSDNGDSVFEDNKKVERKRSDKMDCEWDIEVHGQKKIAASHEMEVMEEYGQQLEATLIDSPSASNSPVLAATLVTSGNSQSVQSVKSSQMQRSLPATLLDSPSQQSQPLSSQGQGKKYQNALSPTLYDDESSMSQAKGKQKKHPQRRSPISLSPTFLDEEVNLNLLSVNAIKVQQLKGNSTLSPTLVDGSDSKPVSGQLLLSESAGHSPLPCTLIDDVDNQKDDDDQELRELIRQKEEELNKLRQGFSKNLTRNNTKVEEGNQKKDYVINVLPSNGSNDQKKEIKGQRDEPCIIAQKKETVKQMFEKQQEVVMHRKNIDLDKVNNFDDLFGAESDEDKAEKNSANQKESSNNSATAQSDSSNIQHSNEKSSSKNNFSGMFKQKFLMRTLTMSDHKKIPILNALNNNAQGDTNIASTLPVTSQFTITTSESHLNNGVSRSSIGNSDFVSGGDEEIPQATKKGKKVVEKRVQSDSEDEDSLGEDPKKRLKVNANWGIIKKTGLPKKTDTNSRDSVAEDRPKQKNDSQPQASSQSGANMVPEDAEGDIHESIEGLRIAVSGFKLRTDEKRGIKAIKGIFVEENNEEFDVLVITEVKRTIKLLLAIMKKRPIVDAQWLKDSINKGSPIAQYSKYPVRQKESFAERFKTDIQTLTKKRQDLGEDNNLFEGMTFYISKSIEDVKDDEIITLVEAGAGSIRKTLPNKQMKKDSSVFVVLSKEDATIYKTVSKLKNVTCVTTEFVLLSAQNSQIPEEGAQGSENCWITNQDYFS